MRNIIDIANIIEKNGGRLYLVGGAVRDKLMNKPPHDEDYCVTGISSEKFEKLFQSLLKEEKYLKYLTRWKRVCISKNGKENRNRS